MKFSFSTTLSCLLLFIFAAFSSPPSGQGYDLAWSDEFNDTDIDTNVWSFDTGCLGGGSGSWEYYSQGKNVTIENGAAVLEARKGGAPQYCFHDYTSVKMNTQGKKEFEYGYFEIRLKAPFGQGLLPAFWTLGSNFGKVMWPLCGEVDLYLQHTGSNVINGSPGNNCFVAACDYQPSSFNTKQYNYSECLCNDYHLYAIEWDSLKIQYYFDGNKFWEFTSINQSDNFEAFHQPHFFSTQIGIGGGVQVDTTIFPQRMYIDYVRVYQKSTQVNSNLPKNILKGMNLVDPSKAQIKIYNLQGRLIADYTDRLRHLKPGDNIMKGLSSNLPIGIYAVRLFDGRKTVSEKLVIQK